MEKMMSEVVADYSVRFQIGLKEMKDNLETDLRLMQRETSEQVISKFENLMCYLDQLHSSQLKDSEVVKLIHLEVGKINKETVSKMQVVCNVERDYQMII
jgi:hypothetical protein